MTQLKVPFCYLLPQSLPDFFLIFLKLLNKMVFALFFVCVMFLFQVTCFKVNNNIPKIFGTNLEVTLFCNPGCLQMIEQELRHLLCHIEHYGSLQSLQFRSSRKLFSGFLSAFLLFRYSLRRNSFIG